MSRRRPARPPAPDDASGDDAARASRSARPGAADVDVVIVSYRGRDLTLRSCASVAAQEVDARLVVVDNAPGDDTADAVARAFPAAELIRMPRNVGFAAAVNRGAAAGGAPWLLLLNPDAELQAGALGTLVDALEGDPGCAAVGPRIVDAAGAVELSVGRTLTPWNELRFRLLERLYRRGEGPLADRVRRRYAERRTVRSLTAACLLLRRRAFEEVGGMDERYFLYAEDVDLCRRLRDAGWSLLYEPGAEVVHLRGASAGTDRAAVERHYRRSQLAYYRKHHGRVVTLLLRLYLVLRYLARAVLAAGTERRRALATAGWILRGAAPESPHQERRPDRGRGDH